MNLYRKEVLENKNQSATGEVLLPNTFSLKLFIIIVIILLCLILLFIIQFSYTDRKTVTGFLTPINGIINVYAPSAGSIDKLFVKNEQQIKAGDTLLTIINKNSGKDVDYNLETKHSLEKSMKILQNQMQLSKQQQTKEKDTLKNDIATLNQQQQIINHQISNQQQKLTLVKTTYQSFSSLNSSGDISALEVRNALGDMIDAQSALDNLSEKKQTLLNDIRTKRNQLKTLEFDTTKKLNDIQLQIEDIEKQLIELNKLSSKSIKAETDGQVTAVSVHQHETVNQSQKLLTIIPTNSTLKAQLLVPPQSIGFVKIGDKVSIRFDAYSYQKYGQGTGKISNISKTTVNSRDLEKSTAIPSMESQAYYIVDVSLDKQYLKTGKDKQSLESGMTISADIKLENRKLYEWILNPLYSLKERN